jgi:glycosyltransferase involved in cell wall biosynthesis
MMIFKITISINTMNSMIPEAKDFHVIVTGTDSETRKGGIGFALPGYIAALESAKISYQLIPTYSPSDSFGKYLLFLQKLPVIIIAIRLAKKEHNTCIVYSHTGANLSLFREGIVTLASRLTGAKTVMQIHSPETIAYLKSPLKKTLFNLAIVGVQQLFVLTPWWKKTYQEMGIKKPLEVISNPLPKAWESKARESIEYSNRPKLNVLVMARIIQGKGADLVVEASPFLADNVQIKIAGTGSLLDLIKTRAEQLKQTRKIMFCGWVAGKEKQQLIDDADIFCHPTQLDAMPMNVLEAMANGLPVVALNWGPIPDLVPAGSAGILVEGTDPEHIARAIEALKDAGVREKMGREAKRWVLDNFTAEDIGNRLNTTFLEVVNL